MSFTVGCRWRGRPVIVTWDSGSLDGDDEVVAYLLSQEVAGEPIGVEEGRVIEASFRSREQALDSLFSLIGPFLTMEGDLGGADPDDYSSDDLPAGGSSRRLDPVRPAIGIAFTLVLLVAGEYLLALIGAAVTIPLAFFVYRSWRRERGTLTGLDS